MPLTTHFSACRVSKYNYSPTQVVYPPKRHETHSDLVTTLLQTWDRVLQVAYLQFDPQLGGGSHAFIIIIILCPAFPAVCNERWCPPLRGAQQAVWKHDWLRPNEMSQSLGQSRISRVRRLVRKLLVLEPGGTSCRVIRV